MTDTAEFPRDPSEPERPSGWLDERELAQARAILPILYVDVVPVRVDDSGDVVAVGLLLRVTGTGSMTRDLVSGRVMFHERVRDALLRHIEKDLGPMALPQVPASPQPFTVAEYLPTLGVTPYHDPRQHAVSLAYVVPMLGDCRPQQDALDLAWLTPEEACADTAQVEMAGGRGLLLRQAMAWVGRMP